MKYLLFLLMLLTSRAFALCDHNYATPILYKTFPCLNLRELSDNLECNQSLLDSVERDNLQLYNNDKPSESYRVEITKVCLTHGHLNKSSAKGDIEAIIFKHRQMLEDKYNSYLFRCGLNNYRVINKGNAFNLLNCKDESNLIINDVSNTALEAELKRCLLSTPKIIDPLQKLYLEFIQLYRRKVEDSGEIPSDVISHISNSKNKVLKLLQENTDLYRDLKTKDISFHIKTSLPSGDLLEFQGISVGSRGSESFYTFRFDYDPGIDNLGIEESITYKEKSCTTDYMNKLNVKTAQEVLNRDKGNPPQEDCVH